MGAVLNVGWQVFAALPGMLLDRWSVLALLLVLFAVYLQYHRLARSEYALYGAVKNDAWWQTGFSLIYGTIGGVLASLILAMTGIAVVAAPVSPLPFLWPLSLALSLLRPRYLGPAYAACLLSLAALITGWPRIDVASLGALVAVLHLTEGLTVALSAPSCASPVTVWGRDGQAAPGFVLRRFWPVPLVVPVVAAPALPGAALLFVPLVVGMGYSGLAVSSSTAQRARRSGSLLVLYGLVLLGLALLAVRWQPALWLVATFCGAGHEALALWGGRDEVTGLPFLRRPGRGVGVLDVLPGSVADAAGLVSGSVILTVGGVDVRSRADVQRALTGSPSYLEIVYRNGRDLRNCRLPRPQVAGELGVIWLPEPGDAAQLREGARGW